jgi:hypothetical protein
LQFYGGGHPNDPVETDLEGIAVMEEKYLSIMSNRTRVNGNKS